MLLSMQPKVGHSQQLIVGCSVATLFRVGVLSKDEVRAAFAARLNEALDDITGCPRAAENGGRGRAAWMARKFSVSGEAASTWLAGRKMPTPANMTRIAVELGVTPQWLQAGHHPKRPTDFDPTFTDIFDVLTTLAPSERQEVLRYARFRAARPPG
jgi:hypothetical protein